MFEDKAPIFSSTKPYTGHTLAAAGAIEAIFSLCTLEQQKAWPNLNFEKQMHDINISPVTEVTDINVEHVLSNSFGFGGSNVSLVFSKA